MSDDIEYINKPQNGKVIAGMILLAVGGVLLLERFFRINLELWPLWLIGWGIFVGVRSNFHRPGSFILIILGAIFLLTTNIPEGDRIFWPILIIGVGIWLIIKRQTNFDSTYWEKRFAHKWDKHSHKWQNWEKKTGNWQGTGEPNVDYTSSTVPPKDQETGGFKAKSDDYLDAVSVFSGIKKTILSKDFKGGEIVNIFGGAELDMTQTDINGRVVIDITQVFGGTKIIVPSHWQVVSDIAAVFAGFDDKRTKMGAVENSNKILVLTGVSIFAGVEIRSF